MPKHREGFTLIEMMVVIAIIGVLIGILLPVVHVIRNKSNETKCRSNLKQIHAALMLYRNDNPYFDGDVFPYRLTHLCREDVGYMDNPRIFICPFDPNRGVKGARKDGKFSETYETGAQTEELPCSYFYEFSGADCSWDWSSVGQPPYPKDPSYFDADGDTHVSWGEVKWKQMKFGDSFLHGDVTEYEKLELKGYPKSLFPVLRCYWHQENLNSNDEKNIINQSFESRQFNSGMEWERSYKN